MAVLWLVWHQSQNTKRQLHKNHKTEVNDMDKEKEEEDQGLNAEIIFSSEKKETQNKEEDAKV